MAVNGLPLNDEEAPCLIFRNAQSPEVKPPAQKIRPSDQFDIGREDVERLFNVRDLTISNHHLRFQCVVYDDASQSTVLPMIYVRVLSTNPARILRPGVINGGDQGLIQKSDGEVLLKHGDVLQLTTDTSILFWHGSSSMSGVDGLNAAQLREIGRFKDQFVVSNRKLGSGGQASVYLATERSSGRQVACKIVSWPAKLPDSAVHPEQERQRPERISARRSKEAVVQHKQEYEHLQREFQILKDLTHPNIISLEKVICTTHHAYIFEELITGGDLLSYFEQKGPLTEPQTAVILRQLLKAVDFLHDRGIVHRDIKPENILMTSWRDGARIVLTDFGQSRCLPNAESLATDSRARRMHTMVGTVGYMAPEIIPRVRNDKKLHGYDKSIDIWSVGCLAATLLTGELLFPQNENVAPDSDVERNTTCLPWDLSIMDNEGVWEAIGRKARAFIRGCLALDETARLTAKQALAHPWFTDKHYAAEMDSAYRRAIQDWTPRPKQTPLIEFIDTSDTALVPFSPEDYGGHTQNITSQFFAGPPETLPIAPKLPLPKHFATSPVRRPTPLPSILQDAEMSDSDEPVPQNGPRLQGSLTGPAQLPWPTNDSERVKSTSAVRFSIEDFAPPITQCTS